MEKEIIKLELTIGDTKVSWEVPYIDASASDLIEAFAGLLVAQTFQQRTIVNNMREYVEEHEN